MTTWISDDGLTRYTHGPDCEKGPNCCCGTCNFAKLGANCAPDCCKCVPKWLCAVFSPDDDPYGEAIRPYTLLSREAGWSGTLSGIDSHNIDNSIQVSLVRDDYENCYYRLSIPARSIEVDYPIEGGLTPCHDASLYDDDRVTCQNPYFQLDDFEIKGNIGTLVIQRKMLQTVPFFSLIEGQSTEAIEPCGYCAEYCNRICLEWTNGATTRKDEFVLVLSEGGDQIYAHPYGDGESATIAIQQNADGECELAITHRDLGTFNPVPIPDGMCAVGMSIESGDEYEPGKSVIISCNRCSCWDYICESCRCVCPVLCVVSIDGSSVGDIDRQELSWDRVKLRWGTDEKWVAVRANPDSGECEFISSAWIDPSYGEMTYDPDASNIDAQCGGEMDYFIAKALTEAVLDGNYRLEWGQCRQCQPDCFGPLICGECCTDCEDPVLPDILYLDLIGRPIAGEDEPGPYAVKCIEVYDLPLVHREPLFAERHRWEGRHIVSCGCPESPETPDPSPDNYLVEIAITCTGDDWSVAVGIIRPEAQIGGDNAGGELSPNPFASFSCSPIAITGSLDLGGAWGDELCCCLNSNIVDFVVSE